MATTCGRFDYPKKVQSFWHKSMALKRPTYVVNQLLSDAGDIQLKSGPKATTSAVKVTCRYISKLIEKSGRNRQPDLNQYIVSISLLCLS